MRIQAAAAVPYNTLALPGQEPTREWDSSDYRERSLHRKVLRLTNKGLVCCAGVVLTCGKDNLLKLTDWRSFQVQRTLGAPGFHVGGVWCRACLGADERHTAAGSADGTLHIWSVSDTQISLHMHQ